MRLVLVLALVACEQTGTPQPIVDALIQGPRYPAPDGIYPDAFYVDATPFHDAGVGMGSDATIVIHLDAH